jgi:hypothetical protein
MHTTDVQQKFRFISEFVMQRMSTRLYANLSEQISVAGVPKVSRPEVKLKR